jgi:thioredoxin reductase (NADPH)
MGPLLMELMREQSINCGTRIKTETVDRLDLSKRPFKVFVGDQTIETKSIIIATGATAKRMNLPGEDRLWQKGISACAVCDGALPIYRNKTLVVVGGGDSAVEESVFLTKFASKVIMLVRRDAFRAQPVMEERAKNNPKIQILLNTVPIEVLGDKMVTGIKVKNSKTNAESTIDAGGLFYAIGHVPNTAFLNGQLELDETGYIKTKPGTTKTSVEGVFACGDVQDKVYRQAITAAGTGCMAALEAEKFLSGH